MFLTIIVCLIMVLIAIASVGRSVASIRESTERYNNDPKRVAKRQEQERLRQESIYRSGIQSGDSAQLIQFYRNCSAQGIRDMSKPADRERIVLYAKANGILGSQEDLISKFSRGKELSDNKDREQKLAQVTEEENKLRTEGKAYYQYRGRDKAARICRDMIAQCDQNLQQLKQSKRMIDSGARSLMKRESDWAVAGGVASGIAGPAAGLAAAIDTQNKNAAVRSYNSAVTNLAANAYLNVFDSERKVKENKEEWEKRLAKVQQSLLEMGDKDELFNLLTVTVVSSRISETGNGRVKLTVRQNRPAIIYESVQAAVDGCIAVKLLNREKNTVAVGTLVFPMNGPGSGITREVVCDRITGFPIPSQFTVQVVPEFLWAMEKV